MTALPLFDRPTAVYRVYASDGVLLYVGITCDPKVRLANHRNHQTWWPEAHSAAIEWLVGRRVARRAESRAIAYEAPRHNVLRPRVRPFQVEQIVPGPLASESTPYAGLLVRGLRRQAAPDDFDVIRATWATMRARAA